MQWKVLLVPAFVGSLLVPSPTCRRVSAAPVLSLADGASDEPELPRRRRHRAALTNARRRSQIEKIQQLEEVQELEALSSRFTATASALPAPATASGIAQQTCATLKTRARIADPATPQPMIDYTARWLQENLPEHYDNALVHNDFRNGNFMVDRNGIVAVLDWEIAHIGDPMRDLGWICTNSWRFGVTEKPVGGFGEYEDLFRGYESVSGEPVNPDHVKFWEVFGSFWWAVGCLGMAEHYRTGPDQTVERPAIGRRSSECQVDCVNLLIPGPVTLIDPAGNAKLAKGKSTQRIDAAAAAVLAVAQASRMAARPRKAGGALLWA